VNARFKVACEHTTTSAAIPVPRNAGSRSCWPVLLAATPSGPRPAGRSRCPGRHRLAPWNRIGRCAQERRHRTGGEPPRRDFGRQEWARRSRPENILSPDVTPAGAAFWASFGRNVAETPMASPLRLSRDWPSRLVIDADNSQGFIRALVIQAVWRQRPTSHGLTGTKLLLGTFEVTVGQTFGPRT